MMFSVVVAVYNVAPYLRGCLDSIALQTYGDWECICVDDGSTDGSGAILDEYQLRDGRFVVIHKNNGGVSSARNAALDIARGEWILYCDADDALIPETLEYLHGQILERPGLDMLGFGYKMVSSQRALIPFSALPTSDFSVVDEKTAVTMFLKLFGKFGGCGACYNRAILGMVRFRNLIQAEDILYGTECLLRARRIAKSYTVLYLYYEREGSCIHTQSLKRYLSQLQFLSEIVGLTRSWKYGTRIRPFIGKFIWNGFARKVIEMKVDVPPKDLRSAWDGVFSAGKTIFCQGWPFGCIAKTFYRVLFGLNSASLMFLWFRVPLMVKRIVRRYADRALRR